MRAVGEGDGAPGPGGKGLAELVFESPAEAAVFYEQRLDWRVGYTSRQVWLASRFDVESLMMLETLGAEVLRRLPKPGPVVRFPGPPVEWAFLTLPQNPLRDMRFPLGPVKHVFGGELLWLPPSNWSHAPLSWVTPPTRDFPPFAVVAETVRQVLRDRRTARKNV